MLNTNEKAGCKSAFFACLRIIIIAYLRITLLLIIRPI